MIAKERFCLNRKAAPSIPLEETIPFVSGLGVPNIEVRNDLYGAPDNASILDHLQGKEVARLLDENHVNVETINAVGNMDSRDMIDENLKSLTEMLEMTKDFNLKNIIFCPVRSTSDHRSTDQRKHDAVANVRDYSTVLKKYGVNGLIEPLGFEDSTLRAPWEGQVVIDAAGVDNFKLVADTFHYYLAGVTDDQFKQKVDKDYIGLVHLSAVTTTETPLNELDDQDRYMLTSNDIMKSAEWANKFEDVGYQGLYAFEPFSDDLKQWDVNQVKKALIDSIEQVQHA